MSPNQYKFNVQMGCGGCSSALNDALKGVNGEFDGIFSSIVAGPINDMNRNRVIQRQFGAQDGLGQCGTFALV